MFYPEVHEIAYQDPLSIAALFSQQPGTVFLDSARQSLEDGRYSFIGVDPFETICQRAWQKDPFQWLQEKLTDFSMKSYPALPPFQGGMAGFFSYDLGRYFEVIPMHRHDEMCWPELAVGLYDLVLTFDHLEKRMWIFSSGYPEKDSVQRIKRAKKRMHWILRLLSRPVHPFQCSRKRSSVHIESNFTASAYRASVQRIIDYIRAGDLFQANLSQRFKTSMPKGMTAFDLYARLRACSPASFAGYLRMHNTVIASASPERFLQCHDRQVETRPIKGTRARGTTREQDDALKQALLQSEKDHAENVMIVDLLRNDLSRVCEPGSVSVTKLCHLESYATVHHLVSHIVGRLRTPFNPIDLLRVAFPGGSITGAPKIRAMQIIAELEPTARGPYCGSMGYIGFDGCLDTSILIRTFAIQNDEIVTFQAGGGVVLDSDPVMEYEETLTKASALKRALYDFTDR